MESPHVLHIYHFIFVKNSSKICSKKLLAGKLRNLYQRLSRAKSSSRSLLLNSVELSNRIKYCHVLAFLFCRFFARHLDTNELESSHIVALNLGNHFVRTINVYLLRLLLFLLSLFSFYLDK